MLSKHRVEVLLRVLSARGCDMLQAENTLFYKPCSNHEVQALSCEFDSNEVTMYWIRIWCSYNKAYINQGYMGWLYAVEAGNEKLLIKAIKF